MYLCTINTDSFISLVYIGGDTALWNHSIGHMSDKGMQMLQKINLFLDIKQIDLDLCEHCVYGKHKIVKVLIVRK